jgi:hypothetical protein
MLRGFFIVVPNSELRRLTVEDAAVVPFGIRNGWNFYEILEIERFRSAMAETVAACDLENLAG